MMGTLIYGATIGHSTMSTTTLPTKAPAAAGRPDIAFNVEGMTCASCVKRVETTALKVPEVEDARVNLATETLTVHPGTGFDPRRLAEAVKASGYDIATERTEIGVEGMTCASCVARVERALRAVPGVSGAAVNLATERATVEVVGAIDFAALATAVADAGYHAIDLGQAKAADARAERKADELRTLRRDLAIAVALTVPLVVLSMGADLVMPLGAWLRRRSAPRRSRPLLRARDGACSSGPGGASSRRAGRRFCAWRPT